MVVEGLRLAVEAVQQTQKVEQVVLQEVELVEAFLAGFQRHYRRRCPPSEALAKYQAKVTLKTAVLTLKKVTWEQKWKLVKISNLRALDVVVRVLELPK